MFGKGRCARVKEMQDFQNAADNPIFLLIRDFAKFEEKLDTVIKNQDIINQRIAKRETENEALRASQDTDRQRITKLETTVDILKFLIGAALAIGGGALVQGIFDIIK